MANKDHIYSAHKQRAALISGEDPNGNPIPGHPVSVDSIGDPAEAEGTLL